MHLVKLPALSKVLSDIFKHQGGRLTDQGKESLLQGQWDCLWSQELAVATTMRGRIHCIAQIVTGKRNLPS